MGSGSNSGRLSPNRSRFQPSLYHRAARGTPSGKGGLIRAGGLSAPGREICQSGQVRPLISTAREPLLIEASGFGERAIDTTSCICTRLLGDLPPARRALPVGHCNAKQRPRIKRKKNQTPLERRGSSSSTGCTKTQPPRPILSKTISRQQFAIRKSPSLPNRCG